MTIRTFDDEITDSLNRSSLSTGSNLLGFDIDLFYYLQHNDQFLEVATNRTDDSRCVLLVTCKASNQFNTLEAVGDTLKQIWLNDLRYEHFQAYELIYEPDQVIFRFVTRSSDDKQSLCVTGKIIVEMSTNKD
jgi:hypothetical protein